MALVDTIVCTDTELTFSVPISHLPIHLGQAATQWLLAHGVDPDEVAVGYPVERDLFGTALSWRINTDRGRQVVTVYPPNVRGVWPAPFPAELRTCLHAPELAA